MAPPSAAVQARGVVLSESSSPLPHSGFQGYLGVDLADVNPHKAQELKLKEASGALITLIDHDAPAGQIGLKVNDVVIQLNGQAVENAAQLRRMLREIPAGRTVRLEISRDGNVQTVAVELADRREIERDIWKKIGDDEKVSAPAPGTGMLGKASNRSLSHGFHLPFFGSSPNVGALLEPLTSQMAEHLGVPSGGLMVKQVAHRSEADAAGLRAFDVILKVGPKAIERALRANQGKPVQLTVLRDNKQQTLTLQVDSKRHGELKFEKIFPAGDGTVSARLRHD